MKSNKDIIVTKTSKNNWKSIKIKSTLDNSAIKANFEQEELKNGHKKYDKSKENKAKLKHIGSFIGRVVLIVAITIAHFFAGLIIMNTMVISEYSDKLQEAASMLLHMFV